MVLAQITENEAGKGENQEKTRRDGIELPPLRKCIADPGFDQIGNAAHDEVQDDEFEQPEPEGFDGTPERQGSQDAFIDKREVGGNRRQQDDKPR